MSAPVTAEALPLTYVLPIRARRADGLDELAGYLRRIAALVDDVIVVDGSDAAVFAAHGSAFGDVARHLRPHEDLAFLSGKVDGVVTGLREARRPRVVVADDDVRYDATALRRVCDLLAAADVVVPQNHFDPLPWHALWDTARTLVARALGHDMPGTLGVRRDLVLGVGGYDGDVLFENLEMLRAVAAAGGRVAVRRDLFVRRRPPTARHFLSQRVRQAYDELARPGRMAVELSLIPAVALSRRPLRTGLLLGALAVALAEAGRRRAGGRRAFPAAAALAAPAWTAERAICSWLALGARVALGGIPYGGVVIRRAATRPRVLRARLRTTGCAVPPPRP